MDEKLVYDSRIWMIGHYSNYYWWPTNVPNSSDGWRFVTGTETGTTSPEYLGYNSDYCDPYWYMDGGFDTNQCYQGWMSYSWTDPTNTVHQFDVQWVYQNGDPYYGWPGGSPQTLTGYAADASGYTIQLSGNNDQPPTSIQIFDTNGTQVYPQVIDRFGNYFSTDGNGNLVDTLGRTPVLVTPNGNVTYYDVLTAGGNRARYTVTMESLAINTSFGQSAVNEWNGNLNAVQSIGLPDGSSYSFYYDNYGAVTSMTLPTGGTVYYGWMTYFDSYNNANRWLISASGMESATLSPSVITQCSGPSDTGCQEQVVVSRASGDTQYSLTLNNGAWDTTTTVYNGPMSNNAPIMSQALTYDFGQTCQQYCGTGAAYITQSTQTNTLSDVGLQSQVQFADMPHLNIPQSIKVWDFGANFSGAPTQETDYTYNNSGNPYSLGNNFLIAGETTLDNGGNQVAKTTYNYTTSATSTSGVVSHGSTNEGGPYLQSVAKWVNTSNSSLTTTFSSDDTGTILSTQDPAGFTTIFGYDATDTFVTSTTFPTPSSGVSLGSSATFDYSTGLITKTTDSNGQSTIYKNYDAFGRVGEIDYPDGGKTTLAYTPTQSSVLQYQNSSAFVDRETIYNTYGVPMRTEVANGQGTNPWYEQDICYNSEGEVVYKSYPYQGDGSGAGTHCSGNGDTITYDALGRVTQVSHLDGTSINTMYTGRAAKITDEYGVSRITQADALGRITGVCEVTSATLPSSNTPANCGLDVMNTGYLTTYSYDLYNHKTTVNQGGLSRIFQSDSVGRPILQQEPESGQTTFGYAYNSTGFQVTRSKPKANQTNSSVLTTTATQYDALGRVLSISYGDGTPTKNFAYDQGNGWGGSFPQNNMKGRLAAAFVSNAATIYGYDPMGRIVTVGECTPSTCGTSGFPLYYTYDWTGNLLSATDGYGVNTASTYSVASEVNSITSSKNDSTHPPNLVSSVQNGPFGPLNWKLGNGLCEARQYDSMGRLSGGGVYSGSNPPNCSSGTQQYGFTGGWTGGYLTSSSDSSLGQNTSYSYDSLGRLSTRNVTSGNPGSFTYSFDQWGNRVAQTVTSGSGPQPSYSFTNNQIQGSNCPTTSQICYDAAGNETSDGFTSYVYDAEGNVTASGTTTYVYDALNQQVRQNYPSASSEVLFGANGQIASLQWAGGSQIMGKAYWGGTPIESYQVSANKAYFQHFDWNMNKRLTTDYSGGIYGKQIELPFGDAFQNVTGARDNTFDDFGGLWDNGSTMHADFREYSDVEGRWMQPDRYGGSYDFSNPQSLNRYVYVNGLPMSLTDPSGQSAGGIGCGAAITEGGLNPGADLLCAFLLIGGGWLDDHLFGGLFRPKFHGSLKPRPNAQPWDEYHIHYGPNIAAAFGLPDASCEFGACGPGAMGFTDGQGGPDLNILIYQGDLWGIAKYFWTKHSPNRSPLSYWPVNGNQWPGFTPQDGVCSTGPFANRMNGNPNILSCCQAHDNCYTKYHCNASSFLGGFPGPCKLVCNLGVEACISTAK